MSQLVFRPPLSAMAAGNWSKSGIQKLIIVYCSNISDSKTFFMFFLFHKPFSFCHRVASRDNSHRKWQWTNIKINLTNFPGFSNQWDLSETASWKHVQHYSDSLFNVNLELTPQQFELNRLTGQSETLLWSDLVRPAWASPAQYSDRKPTNLLPWTLSSPISG